MTIQALIARTAQVGIIVAVAGDRLRVKAPGGALTPELRESLAEHKPALLEVLWRLAGMRQHPDPIPTAKSAQEAPGGPGRCFSCGDAHAHPEAYGRCAWCDVAVEAYYAAQHAGDDAAVLETADEPQRRPA